MPPAQLPEQSALHPARAIDFHDVKGAVEQIAGALPGAHRLLRPLPAEAGLTPAWLHPYRAARVVADGITVGWFGQLHPREAAARKLKEPVLLGEIYLDRLYKLPLRKPAAREISRFQPVRRDFSLVLDQSIAWEQIDQALAALHIPELVEWRAREVFRDAKLGAREYSLLLGVTFQAPDRTLREEELQDFQARVVNAAAHGRRSTAYANSPSLSTSAARAFSCAARCVKPFDPLRIQAEESAANPVFGRVRGLSRTASTDRILPYTCTKRACAEVIYMSQTLSESEVAEQPQSEQDVAQTGTPEPAALALSADDFSALEERVVRAVELVKRERQARAAAEERAAKAEAQLAEQGPVVDQMKQEIRSLRTERDQVRQRVERLLSQLDALEL